MKITICGSIAHFEEMMRVKSALEGMGHEVRIPPSEIADETGQLIPIKQYYEIRKKAGGDEAWVWDKKAESIQNHFNKVAWCDAILVLNEAKNGIEHYVGSNTLMEMGLAFYLSKKIYLQNPIPMELPYTEEIRGLKPIIINSDFSKIQ